MDTPMLVDPVRFERIIDRMAHQLLEHHDFSATDVVGLQPQGARLAERLRARVEALLGGQKVRLGKLDVTFHRDDIRLHDKPLSPQANDMPFLVEGRRVILVDDVLYTGRSVRAGLDALLAYGRPQSVELLVLIDRRFHRELPIEPQYVGTTVDSVDAQYVRVEWREDTGRDAVVLLQSKPE
jgi:pyrimidine operon attenuation protein/uracil phosphoribosyltransferase